MQPFLKVQGVAASFPAPNIDTDVIMPKQFLKGVDRSGLEEGVFHALRYTPEGRPDPAFVLNRPPWQEACFLVTGPNFGCGSSREHAVWGLAQIGIRALIGTSFAGIFNDNCGRNGILTISLPASDVARLHQIASSTPENQLVVDLPGQWISDIAGSLGFGFEIEPTRKEMLMRGLDAVSVTLADHGNDIRAFEAGYFTSHPWRL